MAENKSAAVSFVIPPFFRTINGIITTLLSLNVLCFIVLISAIYFPESQSILMGIGLVIVLCAICAGIVFRKAFLQAQLLAKQELLSLFSNLEDGKADLSVIDKTFEDPTTRKIQKKYTAFLDRFRSLIDEIRKIGLDIAIDSTTVLSTITTTNGKTGQQKQLSETVFTSCNEGSHAIVEVSENTQFVSEKTSENLGMAKQSYEELEDVNQKIKRIHQTVESFIKTVDELEKSSITIQENVDVINGISEQTSLLSLNATIEAARAAEHGKGFAVVAEEVRDLSQRIKPATEDITQQIQTMISIVKKTQDETAEILEYSQKTSDVVNTATGNFKSLITDFEHTEDQMSRIAVSLEELSANNTEITQKVGHINALSQDIAQEMDKSDGTMGMLNQATEKMLEMVSGFKTGSGAFDQLIVAAEVIQKKYEQEIQKISDQGINVFDSRLEKVDGTNPQKYINSFTQIFIERMIPVYEWGLEQIENAIYVLAVDKQGYIPAHHRAFSQPMTGDPDVDLLNSRHQRVFFDTQAEKRRCTHTKPMLLQTYMRDTGQILNDFSMPIYIDGKHWGGMIIGFDPKVMFK